MVENTQGSHLIPESPASGSPLRSHPRGSGQEWGGSCLADFHARTCPLPLKGELKRTRAGCLVAMINVGRQADT